MNIRIVLWPLIDQTLAIVSTRYDQFGHITNYQTQHQLKTEGPDWKLPDLLRELADQLGETE
jgi:hypothetical protein